MPPHASQPLCQEQPQHVVVNLDRELVCQSLLECLALSESLLENPSFYRSISHQLRLRLSYALLHGEVPEFKREEVRRLALFHSQLATSLRRAEAQLPNLSRYSASLKA